jgi:asparagine synthase (glutamine-hydrolysing)
VRLRFRSDVPVGINLSGGLDSSLLLSLVDRTVASESVPAFTFTTGHPDYDELPWVRRMLLGTQHPHVVVRLAPEEVPDLAERVAAVQCEPAGGLPTLAYAQLFAEAARRGVKVLLDGQGVDEAWAGYDYYRDLPQQGGDGCSRPPRGVLGSTPALQGSRGRSTRPEALHPDLVESFVEPAAHAPGRCSGATALQSRQLADLLDRKLPRALRYNDRVSMLASTELREPFLDHRLVELGVAQPDAHKVDAQAGKLMVRRVARQLMPEAVGQAPKRALQTPQREWLRDPLRHWAEALIERTANLAWLDGSVVRAQWSAFADGQGDNSFFVWQWIDLALLLGGNPTARPSLPEVVE